MTPDPLMPTIKQKGKTMSKKAVFIISILLILTFSAFSLFGCTKEREVSKYVYKTMKMGEDGTFKILQLTDIHFINSEFVNEEDLSKSYVYRDDWAMTAITEVIKAADPDLIIVTGDSVFTLDTIYHFTLTNDNEAAFCKMAKFIDSFNIPWALIFGNHDEEGSLHAILGSVEDTKRWLGDYLNSEEIHNCIYEDGPEEINGIGNYIINVVNEDGSTNMPLVLFDSGSYLRDIEDPSTGKKYADQRKYEWVHDDQLDWYETAINDISRIEGKKVESIVFQHIPFPEYGTVIDSYINALTALNENWEDTINVNWTYGKTRTLNTAIGEITYHGGIYDDGAVASSFVGTFHGHTFDGGHEFERLVNFGSTKYVFCGHDHRNTFSFTYKGIRLSYGMSIDYSANGIVLPPIAENQTIYDETPQRGGTLITLGKDSSVSISQVPFTRNLYRETLKKTGMTK